MLAIYNLACKALAEAKAVDEVKNILDKTVAIKEYARQSKNRDLEIDAAEIRMRGERRLGQLLLEMEKNKGRAEKSGAGSRSSQAEPRKAVPRLADMGIDKKLSSRAQKVAVVPEKAYNNLIDEWRGNVEKENVRIATNLIRASDRTARDTKLESVEIPEGVFNVIYADPPWKYQFQENKSREIENHYPTMDLEDIKELEIPVSENSILLMWATAPKLEEAIEVINSWGFIFKTNAVWDKEMMGMGYWFRGQHELLLVGSKGNFPTPEPSNRFSSVIREKRTAHSKKPDIVYSMIETMFPNGKYLELFAHKKHSEKWAVWGNQIESAWFNCSI